MPLYLLLMQETGNAAHGAAAAHGAEAAAPEKFDAGKMILEHILDSHSLELPFLGHVHLPTLHLFGLDLSITKHVVMMWVVTALLLVVGVVAARVEFEAEPGKFDVPDSVIGFLNGDLGDPPGGWPEPFRTKALEGRTTKPVAADLDAEQKQGLVDHRRAALNTLLFPGPTKEFHESREKYGDISVLPTVDYLYGLRAGEEHAVDLEEGKRLLLGLQSVSEPDERGIRTVMCTINGQLRPVNVRDRSVAADAPTQEKADTSDPGHVAAPFDGVVSIVVAKGDRVEAGATVATIEAMKMEAAITAPSAGVVERLALDGTQQVEGGDLVLVLG